MKGVEFLVTDSSGAVIGPNNGYYYTDKDGRITISNLEPGITVTARETKTLDGFILDGTPQSPPVGPPLTPLVRVLPVPFLTTMVWGVGSST